MNVFKVIALFIAGSAREIANEGKESLRLTRNLLVFSVLLPLSLLILGVGLGALGESLDSTGTISTGQGLIVVGAFLASLLLGFVLVRASVLGYVLVAGSNLGRLAFDAFPGIETTEVKEAGRKLSGVMAFITGACLYAQVIPIWRAVGISLIAATSMMGLAYVMASGWYNGKWAKVALTSFMLMSLAFSTARIASPRFARVVAEYNQRMLGSDRLNDTDSVLLRRYVEERNEIRRRAVKTPSCGGRYCNEADRLRVAELERFIAQLQDGSYWENAGRTSAAAAPAVRPSELPTSVLSGGSSSSADLPPPPSVPRREPVTESRVESDPADAPRTVAPAASRARPRTDEIFTELREFPDID